MGNWLRKGAGFAVGMATLAAGLIVPMTAQAADLNVDPLIHYSFNNALDGATVKNEGTAANSDGTVNGTAAVENGQIKLTGSQSIDVPTAAIKDQKDLTVSIWLKNNYGNGNVAAAYIGSPKTDGSSYPTKGYFLLNPANPKGYVKSVMTTATAAAPNGSPWGTEVGPGATNAAETGAKAASGMALYTTVIDGTNKTMSFYLNGAQVGDATYAIPEGGLTSYADLVAYIGKSSYADPATKIDVDDYAVYGSALSSTDVTTLYNNGLLDQAIATVSLPSTATGDFALPATAGAATVAWKVTAGDAITIDGNTAKIDRAKAGDVTLTATFTLNGATATREYVVKVADAQTTLDELAKNYDLGLSAADADFTVPATASGAAVAWTVVDGGDAIAIDGETAKVTRAKDDVTATLKATFTLGDKSSTKEFKIRVIGEGGYLAVYPRGTDTGDPSVDGNIANSRSQAVNIAASETEDGTYTPLNNGQPVVYPQYDTVKYARMGSVLTFRMADGSIGILAEDANKPSNWVWFFKTSDFLHFDTSAAKFTTNLTGSPRPLKVTYDNATKTYTILYQDVNADGKVYTTTTKTFLEGSYSAAKETTEAVPAAFAPKGLQEDALRPTLLTLSASEYDAVVKHYSRIVNTTVTLTDSTNDNAEKTGATVDEGASADAVKATLDGVKATASYTDGSTKSFNVNWDEDSLAAVDTSKAGTYEVTGTVNQPEYNTPLVRERADPDLTYVPETGEYYLTGSYPMCNNNDPEGYDRVVLRHATTINGLTAKQDTDPNYAGHTCEMTDNETVIWDEANSALNRYIWAPELEKIGDSYYILFTASRSSVWDIRPVMLKFTGDLAAGDSLTDATKWTELGQVKAVNGDPLAFKNFSLDMTHFTANGKDYLAWAEKPSGVSKILVAQIDPSNPAQLTSDAIVVSTPEYVWERQDQNGGNTLVNEGPAVLKHNGKVYLFFSNASVDKNYCVSYAMIDEDGDILNASAWTKNTYPMLSSSDFSDRVGPGHNSFSVDENGNVVIVYHARLTAEPINPSGGELVNGGLWDPRRHAFIKTVHFAADGTPVLNQTADEELAAANKTVKFTVTVKASTPAPSSDASLKSLTVAGVAVSLDDAASEAGASVEVADPAKVGVDDVEAVANDEAASKPVVEVKDSVVTVTVTAEDGTTQKVYKVALVKKAEPKPSLRFTDVTAATPHADDIQWLADQGISTGWPTGEGTAVFSPMGPVVRQDMAAFLYRLAGSPEFTPSDEDKARFTDVTDATPHAKEIWWLASTQIAEGFKQPDGSFQFGGNRAVVRQDMAAFLKRLSDYLKADPALGEGVAFTDVDAATPHVDDIQWLARTGVAGGYEDGSFGGMRLVVRQDMAAFLHRMDTNVLTK